MRHSRGYYEVRGFDATPSATPADALDIVGNAGRVLVKQFHVN